jgi:fluoride exporter
LQLPDGLDKRHPIVTVLLAIAIGGALGAMGRFAVSSWSNQRFHHSPIGTFTVNITGALALGIFVGLSDQHVEFSTEAYRLVVTGVLGSYTTFSTMYFETFTLIETEKPTLAMIYAAGSQLAGLLVVFLGIGLVTIW